MAKVNVTVQAELSRSQMRKLNPHLRKKSLTTQEAVDRGLGARVPAMSINRTAFLAALEGVGIKLE